MTLKANKTSSDGGFTLVELIVVIAIIALLAGVGGAAYSGYIKKANEAKDLVYLDAIKTAVFAVKAETGETVSSIIINATDGTIKSISAGSDEVPFGSNTKFSFYFGSDTLPKLTSETYQKGAKWPDDSKWGSPN